MMKAGIAMKFDETSERSVQSKVVDLASFRKKKETDEDLARGRRPLYVSHMQGRISSENPESKEFGDRLTRIRASLDKINRLMSELKKISASAEDSPNSRGSVHRRK